MKFEAIWQESETELLAALRLVARSRAISQGRTRCRPKIAVSASPRALSLCCFIPAGDIVSSMFWRLAHAGRILSPTRHMQVRTPDDWRACRSDCKLSPMHARLSSGPTVAQTCLHEARTQAREWRLGQERRGARMWRVRKMRMRMCMPTLMRSLQVHQPVSLPHSGAEVCWEALRALFLRL